MSEHTKEPWNVAEEAFDNDGIHESVIRGLDGRAAIAVTLEFGPNNPGMREANARRIVACVNACAGISTENLEDNKPLAEGLRGLNERIRQAEQQRDTAWQELREIRQQINANPEEATTDEAARVVAQRDKLLATLKECLPYISEAREYNKAVAVIAEVKGQS